MTLIHPQTNERITVNIDQLANDIEFCGPGMNVKQASVEEILGNINNKTAVMYGFNQQSTGEVEVADVNGKTHTIVDYHAYSVAAADENTSGTAKIKVNNEEMPNCFPEWLYHFMFS